MALSASTVHSITARNSDHEQDNVTSSPYQHEHRVEPIPRNDFPHEKYPRWIGHKFEPDGRVLPFPGNTVICHLSPDSALHHALLTLYDELKSREFASLYVLLPPTSWHMTVFEGVSDQIRKHSSWPGDLSLDAPLNSCTALVEQKLADFDLRSEPPFRMAVDGFEPLEDGIALKVVPATPAEESRLRHLRDRLSKVLQIRHPGHDTYSFHVSLSYMLRRLDQRPEDYEKIWAFLQEYRSKLPDVFELGAPEFCIFDDMFAFRRQFFLGTQS